MIRAIWILVAICLAGFAGSQPVNDHLCDNIRMDSTGNKKLFLEFENISFVRNNEYFNQICDGYTLIGFSLFPTVSYYFTPKLKVSGGFYLLAYFGMPDYAALAPLLTLQYEATGFLDVIFGRLYGTVNHRLIDPLFGFDRYYSDPVENGLQVRVDHPVIWNDTWIDWQRFILPHDTHQEEFTVGSSSIIHLLKPEKKWQVELPVQGILFHKGGQIQDLDEVRTTTILDVAGGAGLSRKLPGFVQQVDWYAYGVGYQELGNPKLDYRSGWGYYTTVTLFSRYGSLQTGYWNADRYYAPLGDPLYQSISRRKPGVTAMHREILFGKFIFFYPLAKGICLDARIEAYVYPRKGHVDYAYALSLAITQEFFLKKVEPRPDLQ